MQEVRKGGMTDQEGSPARAVVGTSPGPSPASGAATCDKCGGTLVARTAVPATPQDQEDKPAKRRREPSPPAHVTPSANSPAAAQLVKEIHRVAQLATTLGFPEAKPIILSAIGAYEQLGEQQQGQRYAWRNAQHNCAAVMPPCLLTLCRVCRLHCRRAEGEQGYRRQICCARGGGGGRVSARGRRSTAGGGRAC